MRRQDRALNEKQDLLAILDEADVCRIAMNTSGAPYIIPLNFGFSWDDRLTLYFHSADEGRKIDLFKIDNRVGFEIDTAHEIIRAEKACNWSMKFKSIVGTGKIYFIPDENERNYALNKIIQKYGYSGNATFSHDTLKRMTIYRLEAEVVSGKQKR